jgi:chitinase
MKKSFIMGTTTTSFLFVLLFISSSVNAQFKMVGYLTNWGNLTQDANNVDYTKVTHLNIAFINPDNSGNLSPTTSLTTVNQTIHNNNAKVLASLGGAGASSSWPTLMEAANRGAFITKIVNFSKTYNFDGIDMDLEGSFIDNNYNDFVLALSTALKAEDKLLTAAVATWNGWDIYDNTLAAFDFVNIMSYDKYGTWTGPGQHASYADAVSDLNYWGVTRGLAKSKLVLGLPNYGYRWESTNSSMTIKQIVNAYSRAINQDSIHTTNGIIYYNGIPTIKQKTALAIDKASGVMWWTQQFDFASSDSRSLIRAMDEVIQASLSVTPVVNSNDFTIYPNPVNDELAVNSGSDHKGWMKINLYDLSGKEVMQKLLDENIQTINVSDLAQGMYTCVISSNDKISVLKIVKQ